jgi:hypothetical protein
MGIAERAYVLRFQAGDVFALLFMRTLLLDPGVRKRGRGQIGHASLWGVAHAT